MPSCLTVYGSSESCDVEIMGDGNRIFSTQGHP